MSVWRLSNIPSGAYSTRRSWFDLAWCCGSASLRNFSMMSQMGSFYIEFKFHSLFRSFLQSKELIAHYDALSSADQTNYLKHCEHENGREVGGDSRYAKRRKPADVQNSSTSDDQTEIRIHRVCLFEITLFYLLFRLSNTFRSDERRFNNRRCFPVHTWMRFSARSLICFSCRIRPLFVVTRR